MHDDTPLHINADFDAPAVVRPQDMHWTPSPLAGVERIMLDRVGGEVARATSLVRYAPDSAFNAHTHDGGEEIFVLSGTFCDASGEFGPGSYVRNPPGSSHAPWSARGCTIFVKLRQFAADDLARVVIDTARHAFAGGQEPGVDVMPLHAHGSERVSLVRFAPDARSRTQRLPGGAEILVLRGAYNDERAHYREGTWVRHPPGSAHTPYSDAGCLLYVKHGHLKDLARNGKRNA